MFRAWVRLLLIRLQILPLLLGLILEISNAPISFCWFSLGIGIGIVVYSSNQYIYFFITPSKARKGIRSKGGYWGGFRGVEGGRGEGYWGGDGGYVGWEERRRILAKFFIYCSGRWFLFSLNIEGNKRRNKRSWRLKDFGKDRRK